MKSQFSVGAHGAGKSSDSINHNPAAGQTQLVLARSESVCTAKQPQMDKFSFFFLFFFVVHYSIAENICK